ncbi:MAG: ribosomal RNA small subunit methyltransferase A [Clostridia bacterium]|nr:ribosomal RNA small subunit methyltransferase A [Clostridia bacterium]
MEVTKILQANNFEFAKKFGQNFITDTNLLNAIVEDCNLNKNDEVLEIGTGAGTLTRAISQKAKRVVTFEIDNRLKDILKETLKDCTNVELNFADIMTINQDEIDSKFENGYSLIANLPYYITTPIIFKFLESKNLKSLNIMVQKEVAERICATSGKDYGILSIMIDFYGNAKIKRIVKRNMFTPPPNVDSAIVSIEINQKYDCNKELFSQIVHKSFAMRRKTLFNNLKQGFNLNKEQLDFLLKDYKQGVRAEELSTQDFVNLTNLLDKMIND